MPVGSPGGEDPLEEGMTAHSSILAWRIPGTEEPGRLQSMGHKESDTASSGARLAAEHEDLYSNFLYTLIALVYICLRFSQPVLLISAVK